MLEAIVDHLLPGGQGFPSASDTDLASWMAAQRRFAPAVSWLIERLPDDFAALPQDQQLGQLQAAEAADSERFGVVVIAAYSGYYTHRAVLAAVETHRGYKAGPPQPGGYALQPFDPQLLQVPSGRGPSYRDPDT